MTHRQVVVLLFCCTPLSLSAAFQHGWREDASRLTVPNRISSRTAGIIQSKHALLPGLRIAQRGTLGCCGCCGGVFALDALLSCTGLDVGADNDAVHDNGTTSTGGRAGWDALQW